MEQTNGNSGEGAASPRSSIGSLLRQWRQQRGLSQQQLGAQAGVAVSTLSRWECGTTLPGIPEWESVLQTLGVSRQGIVESLRLFPAPRALRRLRTAPKSSRPLSGIAPPVGGDLLRAMRRRRGFTQAELASQLGVPQNTITRWERSETWPDTTQLHSLCYHLEARVEEVAALSVGRFSLTSLLDVRDPDTLHQVQWQLRVEPNVPGPDCALKDLRYLALEAHFHSLLSSRSTETGTGMRLLRLLCWTYSRHAQYLMETGRFSESVAPAQTALYLHRPLWATRNHEAWVPATLALAAEKVQGKTKAEAESRSPRTKRAARTAYRSSIELLHRSLDDAYSPEYLAWMFSAMAKYGIRGGFTEQAIGWSREAVRIVEEADRGDLLAEQWLRRRDHACLLLAAGRPADAVPFLPQANWSSARENIRDLYVRAEILGALQDQAGASDALSKAQALQGSVAQKPDEPLLLVGEQEQRRQEFLRLLKARTPPFLT